MSEDSERKRFRAFFDNSPDVILVVGSDGRIQHANARVEDVFGYRPADIEGEPVEVLVPEAMRDEHPDLRDAYFSDPSTRPMGAGLELRGRHADGSRLPVEIGLSPVETEGDVEVIAAVRDRSEAVRLERKYRTVLETAPDAVFVIDAETGELLEANRAATELLGVPEDALLGRDQTVLHPSDETDRYRALFEDHVDRGLVTTSRFENGDDILVDGADGVVPVEVSTKCIELADREVAVAMFRDISKRREYEADLNHQIDRLERLAQVLSHDLRNPLNVAEGNLELAREQADLERLSEVERAHDRMRDIVEDVLTMVRGGTEVESVEPLVVSDVAAVCWANVETAGAVFEVATDGIVYADEGRARHLFENLFRNAVEHGSTVDRNAERSEDAVEHGGDDVTVRVGVSEGSFYVEDDGPGIPEGDREAVLESGWTTSPDGSGLGLSIVADVATAHDWSVTVAESPEGGARFEFSDVRTAAYDDSFVAE